MAISRRNGYREVNFDGLVGPTHNYAGLAHGNLASAAHRLQVSHPRKAALEGLAKMNFVAALGIPQFVIPPHRRPWTELLESAGFVGDRPQMISAAARDAPHLLAACYSASNMWTANAATISPSPDCDDRRLHVSPANLTSGLHRSLEAGETARLLSLIFSDPRLHRVHPPLPGASYFGDEGAANHTRLCHAVGQPGIELFVYGVDHTHPTAKGTQRFTPRQSRQASEAIIRRHRLDPQRSVLAQQHPRAIDAGVFHNDVIAVGHENVMLFHEYAFAARDSILDRLTSLMGTGRSAEFHAIQIDEADLPLADAVSTYLFNSQLLSPSPTEMLLVCPSECQSNQRSRQCIDRLLAADNPIRDVKFFDLRESMQNGGGPACLRLRVVVNEAEANAIQQGVRLTDQRYQQLVECVNRNYRTELRVGDLCDSQLITECDRTFEELSEIFGLPL